MRTKTIKRNARKITVAIFVLLCIVLAYLQLWYHPTLVEGQPVLKLERVIRGHQGEVWSARFSPDGNYVVSGGVDGNATITEVKTGNKIQVLNHPGGISYLCYSRKGDVVITSGYDKVIRIWNAQTGSLIRQLKGQSNVIRSLDISPDGRLLASGDEKGVIKLWKIATGECLRTATGHKRIIWSVKFSPDGHSLASASFDYIIRIWDVQTGMLKKTLTGHTQAVVSVAFSHNGKWLASASDDKTIRIWSTADFSMIRKFHQPEHAHTVCFSPDDRLVLAGGSDKVLLGELLQNFIGDSHFNPGVSMRLWDLHSGKLVQTFRNHYNDVNDVNFSPDGKHMVSASSDFTVGIWKIL